MTSQLPVLEKQLENGNAELKSINSNLANKKQELASLKESLAKLKKLAEDTLAQTKQEVLAKMEDAKVTEREIKEIAKLKAELDKKGLDIPTLVNLGKEYAEGWVALLSGNQYRDNTLMSVSTPLVEWSQS